MAFDPTKLDSLRLLKSSGITGGDCLGGLVSMERVGAFVPLVISDEIDALEIVSVGRNNTDSTTYPAHRFRDVTISYLGDSEYMMVCNGVNGDIVEIVGSGLVSCEPEIGIYVWAVVKVRRIPTIGTMMVRMCAPWNNIISMADVDYGGSDYQYRCGFLYASEDLTITNVSVSSGLTYSYNGDTLYTAPVADGYTSPGLVFSGSGAVSIALTAGDLVSVWFRSETVGQGMQGVAMWITYEIDGEDYTQRYEGVRRIPDASLEGYVLYESDDTVSAVGTEVDTSPTLPFTYAVTPPVSGTEEHRFRVALRNRYNIESDNLLMDNSFLVDDGGEDTTVPPDVAGLTATAEAQGYAVVAWQYADQQGASVATSFLVSMTDGATTLTQAITRTQAADYSRTIGPLLWGVVATVEVVAVDATGAQSAGASTTVRLDAASDIAALNSQAIQATTADMQGFGNSAISVTGTLARFTAQGHVLWSEDTYGIMTRYALSDVLTAYDLIGFALVNADLTGTAGADPIVVVGDKIYLCAGGVRVAEFDTTNVTLKAKYFSNVINECPIDTDIYETADRTYFQIADASNSRIRTWMAVSSDGTLYLPIGVTQTI